MGIVEHASDERAFAIIDAASGAKAQQADVVFASQRRHQK
jgi:hypothetical protein